MSVPICCSSGWWENSLGCGDGDIKGEDLRVPSERDTNLLDGRASWECLGMRLSDWIFHTMVNRRRREERG